MTLSGKLSDLTGKANYFEDFKVGEVLKHAFCVHLVELGSFHHGMS